MSVTRVGVPSWIDARHLGGFPEGVQVVGLDPARMEEQEVEFVLAPWVQAQAGAVLGKLRGVKVVQAFQSGVEMLVPLVPEGAVLCNAAGLHTIPTAEWAVSSTLAALKFLPWYVDLQREERWAEYSHLDLQWDSVYGVGGRPDLPVRTEELYGKRVVIVGYGEIGKAIEARLAPFEPGEIVRVARTPRAGVRAVAELDELLPEADVVILILPLTPDTRGLIGERQLALMKRGAVLVNAARGPVVDTGALVKALEERRVRAVLDVTDPEPLPAGHALWKAPGCLITPHVAGSSPMFLRRVLDFTRAQVGRMVHGEPLQNVIRGAY